MTIEERFWRKVDIKGPDECWERRNGKQPRKYSIFEWREDGKPRSCVAHRMAWILTYGPIPDGLIIRHRCPGGPNSLCCNPAHLRIGTTKDNHADREEDGHTPKGVRNGRAKLMEDDVRWIRWVYKDKRYTQRQLAQHLGVTSTMIGYIVRRKNWKHVR